MTNILRIAKILGIRTNINNFSLFKNNVNILKQYSYYMIIFKNHESV